MSIQAVAWVLGLYIPDPHAKLILLSLANHANQGGFCHPRMKMIASEASCDRRTVLRKLPALEEARFLRIIPRRNGKERLAHDYQLLMPGCDPQSQPPSRRPSQKAGPTVARGFDTRVTTKNHQTTVTSPLPPSLPLEQPKKGAIQRKEVGREERPTREGPEVVQNGFAKRPGLGGVAFGWNLLGQLSDSERDQLTATNWST
jgi:Helix-turn-helix domain